MRVYLIPILSALVFAGCSTSPSQPRSIAIEQTYTMEDALQLKDDGRVPEAAKAIYQIAERSAGDVRLQYLFDAAQLYLEISNTVAAADMLKKIQGFAPDSAQAKIITAQFATRDGNSPEAVMQLQSLSLGDLPESVKGIYWLAVAEAYEAASGGSNCGGTSSSLNKKKEAPLNLCVMHALHAYIKAEESLVSTEYLTKEQNAIWKLMLDQPVGNLKVLKTRTKDNAAKAWLDLGILAKEAKGSVREKDIAAWRKKYPNQVVLNQRLLDLQGSAAAKSRHIALILPTKSSELGSAAKAVWEGFKTAQKEGLIQQPIKLYETDAAPAATMRAYNNAIAKEAILIIGPLPRTSLSLLAQRKLLAVPTVALNIVDDEKTPTNLYQFGLPITHEARIVARAAKEKGYTEAIVLKGNGSLDMRSADAFTKEWASLNNTIKSELPIKDIAAVQKLLAAPAGQHTMVFVAADFQTALPILKSTPSTWAMFGTSSLNTNSPAIATLDKNLKIYFVDVPTLLSAQPGTEKMPAPVNNPINFRLYSLGMDAYRLAALLLRDEVKFNRTVVDGATGKLSITRNGNVERELPLMLLREANLRNTASLDHK